MQKLSKKSVISIVLASIFTVATIITCCLLFIPTRPVSLNPDTGVFTVDTAYAGNVSETEIFYTQTIVYVDGI